MYLPLDVQGELKYNGGDGQFNSAIATRTVLTFVLTVGALVQCAYELTAACCPIPL